jgi:hypothetical protein
MGVIWEKSSSKRGGLVPSQREWRLVEDFGNR